MALKKMQICPKQQRSFYPDRKRKTKILNENAEINSGSFRTLGLAYKKIASFDEKLDENLVFIGLSQWKILTRRSSNLFGNMSQGRNNCKDGYRRQ
jgi:hypothetical protein